MGATQESVQTKKSKKGKKKQPFIGTLPNFSMMNSSDELEQYKQ